MCGGASVYGGEAGKSGGLGRRILFISLCVCVCVCLFHRSVMSDSLQAHGL